LVLEIAAEPTTPTAGDEARFRTLYKTLIEIDTTRSNGDCSRAAQAMQLFAADFTPDNACIYAPADRSFERTRAPAIAPRQSALLVRRDSAIR
jgi:hypothetical protein